jgi:hypothetical protein
MTEIYWPDTGTADVVRMEGVPGDLSAGIYRVEFCGTGEALLPGESGMLALPVFRFLGADDPEDDSPPWRRPGVRYLTTTEQRQIRALYAQRDEHGKRRHSQAQLAARFGTTATTVSRLTRPADHVPVPRRRRKQIIHDNNHDRDTGEQE